MQREEHDEAPLRGLDEGKLGKREEAVERFRAFEGETQGEEVQRHEQREREPREPMGEKRPVAGAAPRCRDGLHPGSTTAATARSPSASRMNASARLAASRLRPRHRVHSRATLRAPIGAWTATAITNNT